MKKILLIFWPEGGSVDASGEKIAELFTGAQVKKTSLNLLELADLEQYDNWIIGGSTVGAHVWEDADDTNRWFEFFKMIRKMDLSQKVIALYGLGNQVLYPQHFVDGLGFFQDEFEKHNLRIVGKWPVAGYEFTESDGMRDGYFFGLALDEDFQADKTQERIIKWIELIREEFK